MGLFPKFMIVFALAGLILSLATGLIVGNRLTHVLVTTLICTILGGGLGAGVYKTLELRVPEAIAFLQGGGTEGSYDEEFVPSELGEFDAEGSGYDSSDEGDIPGMGETGAAAGSQGSGDAQVFGDHILVNDVKIKNEPKLMAKAIQTMLSRDEES